MIIIYGVVVVVIYKKNRKKQQWVVGTTTKVESYISSSSPLLQPAAPPRPAVVYVVQLGFLCSAPRILFEKILHNGGYGRGTGRGPPGLPGPLTPPPLLRPSSFINRSV